VASTDHSIAAKAEQVASAAPNRLANDAPTIGCVVLGYAEAILGYGEDSEVARGLGLALDFEPEKLLTAFGWKLVGGLVGAALGCEAPPGGPGFG